MRLELDSIETTETVKRFVGTDDHTEDGEGKVCIQIDTSHPGLT